MARIWEDLTGRHQYAVRNVDGGLFLERFFVSGVAALLLLRFYLEITGYPQVGGGALHLAHLLWGGLLMLAAIVMLLGFLGHGIRSASAILGGIGFGLFIDEVGKFITRDNDYFFRPAIAIIYIVFVVLFLVIHAIEREGRRSETGYLVNALNLTAEAILHGFDRANRDRALALLDRIPPANELAAALHKFLTLTPLIDDARTGRLTRLSHWARARYNSLVRASWFWRVIIAGFFIYAVLTSLALILVLASELHLPLRQVGITIRGELGFTTVSDLMIVAGVVLWHASRLRGLLWFKRAILVSILLAQPFLFYSDQLSALAWLVIDLVLYETLNYMIAQERLIGASSAHTAAHSAIAG